MRLASSFGFQAPPALRRGGARFLSYKARPFEQTPRSPPIPTAAGSAAVGIGGERGVDEINVL